MMEKFTKPELLEFLCDFFEADGFSHVEDGNEGEANNTGW